LVQLCCRLADDFNCQSIYRQVIQKPEETIAQLAPELPLGKMIGEVENVRAAIDQTIQTLDF